MERVSELVKRQLGEIVQELYLPDCGFVTVTAARISPDLHEGRVYVSIIGTPEQQKRGLAGLTRARGRIQGLLAHRVILKYTPHLEFLLDDTEVRAREIEHLIDEVNPDNPE